MSGRGKVRGRAYKGRPEREKLDCYGVPVRLREEAAQRKKEELEAMHRSINDLVAHSHKRPGAEAIDSVCFYVVCASLYVQTDEGFTSPAEISLVKCSLRAGITREFHVIIQPQVPVSYRWEALEYSQASHNLLSKGQDYLVRLQPTALSPAQAAQSIKEFLKGLRQHTPLYTLHSDMDLVKQILHSLTGDAGLRVYSLDLLYQSIYSAVVGSIPVIEATEVITQCLWEYREDLACEWHRENEPDSVRYCTLSCIKRWVFLMCRHIGPNLGLELMEGQHCPEEEPPAGAIVNMALLMQEGLSVSNDLYASGCVGATTAPPPAPVHHTSGCVGAAAATPPAHDISGCVGAAAATPPTHDTSGCVGAAAATPPVHYTSGCVGAAAATPPAPVHHTSGSVDTTVPSTPPQYPKGRHPLCELILASRSRAMLGRGCSRLLSSPPRPGTDLGNGWRRTNATTVWRKNDNKEEEEKKDEKKDDDDVMRRRNYEKEEEEGKDDDNEEKE